MTTRTYKTRAIVTACSLALLSMGAIAADPAPAHERNIDKPSANARVKGDEAKDAKQHVADATKVVNQMERDKELSKALQQAQGVFIVPTYGRAALGVGARGGEGVLLVKHNGKWSDPAFYNIGGVSLGLQAGAEGGAIAMILNNEKAVNTFMQNNNWSLNADAGLTMVNWSKKAQASAGKGDVIVWSNTKGLMGDLAVSVTDINFDEDEAASFYGKQVALKDIIDGKVKAPARQVAALKQALPGASGSTSSGSSSGMSDSEAGTGSTHKMSEDRAPDDAGRSKADR